MDSSIFPSTVFDRYDMGMGVGYVSDTRTQFRHSNYVNFEIFKEKQLTLAGKEIFLAFHLMRERIYILS